MALPPTERLLAWLRRLAPVQMPVDLPEKLRAALGALLGILCTALVGRWALGPSDALPWLIAPMGASAVLLYAVPASPLAQPWSVVGGNLVAAVIGVACRLALHDPVLAASAAIALAIAAMLALRCLHPPAGAVALTAVLGGPAVQELGYGFVLAPVMLNSLTILLVALVFNPATHRSYPHAPATAPPPPAGRPDTAPHGFLAAELDAVLREHNAVLEISRADLQQLFQEAGVRAWGRRLGEIRCADIMTPRPVAVAFGTPLGEAWELMQKLGVKALPVVDRARRVVGILTRADFMRHARVDEREGLRERLHSVIRASGLSHGDKPEVVGQIMAAPAQTVAADAHVTALIHLLIEQGHSHVPIVDAENRLAGIVTPRDLIAALYRASLR